MATTTTNFGWDIPQSTDLVKDGATAIAALGQDIDTALVDLKGGTTGQVLSKASGTDLDFTWVAQDDSNAIQNAIVDAKGDIIAATAADTPARLAVGTNGQVLTADSTAATGIKWATPSTASGLTYVTGGTFSAQTSVSVNNSFSSTYDNYVLILDVTTTNTSNVNYRLRASGTDSSASYYFNLQYFNPNSTTANAFIINNGSEFGQLALSSTTSAINMYVTLRNPFLAKPTYVSQQYSKNNPPSGDNGEGNGIHNVSSAYDGITFFTTSGSISGSYKIYGMANS
jgi:hypothetical protein